MPTVLITGITGFLAAHVALVFLKNGWHVRGTLRSNSKRDAVLSIPEYKSYVESGHLQLYATGSLEDGHYDEAIKGVDAVVHTASPVEFDKTNFKEDFLKPALNGTKGVLEAAAKEDSVKAVVMTSTYGAVGDHRKAPVEQVGLVLTEDDWNPYTIEELDQMSKDKAEGNGFFPAGGLFYKGAKKYAELEAWDIQKRTGAKWSLATMLCTMIWGPPIQPLSSLSKGGMSTEYLYSVLKGPKDADLLPIASFYPYYVDVRNAAEAHYQAVVPYDFQEFADIAHKLFPDEERIPVGTPGKYIYNDPGVYTFVTDKSKKELGLTYRPKEDTVRDAFLRFMELEKQGLN